MSFLRSSFARTPGGGGAGNTGAATHFHRIPYSPSSQRVIVAAETDDGSITNGVVMW
jgi:hypothetical protein